MKKNFNLFALAALLFFSCKQAPIHNKYTFKGKTMGSYYAVTYFAESELVSQESIEEFLNAFNKSLSTWDTTSLLTALNNANEKHYSDSFFRELYKKSKEVNHISEGAFDPTATPLFEAWGFGLKNTETMDSSKVDSLLRYVGIYKCYLRGDTLYKMQKKIKFSFNAIAPGYAADLIGKLLEQKGITSYLVDIGGEFKSKGIKPDSSQWIVGIEQPIENKNQQNAAQGYITLKEGEALATSGNYRKFYYKDGKKYSHTINPKTGYPVNHNLLSVTIVTTDATTADAYATTCLVMGLEKAKEFVKAQNVKAYFIYDENDTLKEYVTDNLKNQLSK